MLSGLQRHAVPARQSHGGWRLLASILMILTLHATVDASPLRLKHEKFKVTSVRENWCGEVVNLRVDAIESGIFARPGSQLLQGDMVGGVRAVIPFTCPKATRINFSGWSKGKLVFAGAAWAENQWRLIGFYVAAD